MSSSHPRRCLPPYDCPAVDLPLKSDCKWLGMCVESPGHVYIHHSLEFEFVIKTCTYCMRRAKWKSIITDSRLWTRAVLSKLSKCTDKASGRISVIWPTSCSWGYDDDFLAKGRTNNYFVISFLFLYTNWWLLITQIKFRCRLMTRQTID